MKSVQPIGQVAFCVERRDAAELCARWGDAGQLADPFKKKQVALFNYLGSEAREILDDLSEKYASDGELQFRLPDVLKLPPISHHGNVNEIIGKFGVADQLRDTVRQLQSLLYA